MVAGVAGGERAEPIRGAVPALRPAPVRDRAGLDVVRAEAALRVKAAAAGAAVVAAIGAARVAVVAELRCIDDAVGAEIGLAAYRLTARAADRAGEFSVGALLCDRVAVVAPLARAQEPVAAAADTAVVDERKARHAGGHNTAPICRTVPHLLGCAGVGGAAGKCVGGAAAAGCVVAEVAGREGTGAEGCASPSLDAAAIGDGTVLEIALAAARRDMEIGLTGGGGAGAVTGAVPELRGRGGVRQSAVQEVGLAQVAVRMKAAVAASQRAGAVLVARPALRGRAVGDGAVTPVASTATRLEMVVGVAGGRQAGAVTGAVPRLRGSGGVRRGADHDVGVAAVAVRMEVGVAAGKRASAVRSARPALDRRAVLERACTRVTGTGARFDVKA